MLFCSQSSRCCIRNYKMFTLGNFFTCKVRQITAIGFSMRVRLNSSGSQSLKEQKVMRTQSV